MLPLMEDQIAEYGNIFERCIREGGEKGGHELLHMAMRALCQNDLFYLLAFVLGRVDVRRQWLYERCVDIQAEPDGYLDLWAREHYKSTIITFALTIQDILNDPNITVGIFSHTKSISRGFLKQIKFELETNERLKRLFPDILYQDPKKDAPKIGNSWTDEGITVKRTQNSKECTCEAHGVVDGQPTSKHFKLLLYDDIVTLESVSTPEQITKTTGALAISYNLGAHGGRRRWIGTRYHFNDTYKAIIDRGTATPRIHPATDNGKDDGAPVFLEAQALMEKRRDMGPYVFGCLGADTQILMADWSVRSIHAVKEGDMVVGWTMEAGQKSKLVSTRVVATQHHRADTVDVVMDGGQKIVCTPDHKWWTGRRVSDRGRQVYRPLGLGYSELSSLCRVVDLTGNRWPSHPRTVEAAAYLAGIFDGEGTVSGKCIHISQCERTHPEVCNRIRQALGILGFNWNEHRPKGREHQIDFCINGGRQEQFRFLALCDPAKRGQVARAMFGARDFGKDSREAIAAINPGERQMVYNIQTETGNYVANGYCSKNCQMLQDPTADSAMGFKVEWLKYYETEPELGELNIYILVDPANSKKKASDYTVMWVVGLAPDRNYYLLDGIHDRLNLTQRTDALFQLHQEYTPEGVGYEHFGIQADIQHIEAEMERMHYRFNITPLSDATPKNDRIRRLVPLFEQGRIIMPRSIWKTNYEGKRVNLITELVNDEYTPFPVMLHDDMLDDLANIRHPKMVMTFPRFVRRQRKESWQDKLRRKLNEAGGGGNNTTHMSN